MRSGLRRGAVFVVAVMIIAMSLMGCTATQSADSPSAGAIPTDQAAAAEAESAQVSDENTVEVAELMAFLADDDPYLGPVDAPVVIVEFSDYLCPYCGKFYMETLPQIMEAYPDQVMYVHRDYPIFGDTSVTLALSAGCAIDQDLFWDLHRVYLEFFKDLDFEALSSQPKDPERFQEMVDYYSNDQILAIAENVGLDLGEYAGCMADQRHLNEIAYDYQVGSELGIQGLPFFVVNGQPIFGAQEFDIFQSVIEESLTALG